MAFDVVHLPTRTISGRRSPRASLRPNDRERQPDSARSPSSRARTSSAGSNRCSAPPNPPPTTRGKPINWPTTPAYVNAGLVGQMEGSIAWHSPTTENPALGSTEEWEIWNATGDAHPVHLHLVNFEVLGPRGITWDSATNPDDRVLDPAGATTPPPNGDGTYLVAQPVVQHNGLLGNSFRIVDTTIGAAVPQPPEYVENAPKDMVTALAGPGHTDQGDLRQARPLRLALPHPVPRGPRDDAGHVRGPRRLTPTPSFWRTEPTTPHVLLEVDHGNRDPPRAGQSLGVRPEHGGRVSRPVRSPWRSPCPRPRTWSGSRVGPPWPRIR